MSDFNDFDIKDFMPYLLNQAADASSLDFQVYYRDRYGMLRTEWRVLFHLGRYGQMGAKQICERANIHKTKVSRAVSALEAKRYLTRAPSEADRRREDLDLTALGQKVFTALQIEAAQFDAALMSGFSTAQQVLLRRFLHKISGLKD